MIHVLALQALAFPLDLGCEKSDVSCDSHLSCHSQTSSPTLFDADGT